MFTRLRALAREAANLVTPVACAGCGVLDIAACDTCLAELYRPLRRIDADARYLAGTLPTYASADYAKARRLILAYKNHARRDIAPFVLAAARSAGEEWFSRTSADARDVTEVAEHLGGGGCLVAIPAPSGRARRWRRRLVAAELAEAFLTGVRDSALIRLGAPPRLAVADILRKPLAAELSGHLAPLGAADRAAARRAAVVSIGELAKDDIAILIDDIVTTGATLGASVRTLRRDGVKVASAWALAATEMKSAPGALMARHN